MSDCDLREIVRTLELFVEPDGVGELRAIGCGDRKRPVSIYFAGDELEEIALQAAEISATAKGVYVVMNRLPRELLERSPRINIRRQNAREATKDADIVRRRWLLIDCDPHSPARGSDDSATDAEKHAAQARMEAVQQYLRERGFPEPVVCDSGNGWHLLYRIDLNNDHCTRDLLKSFLRTLSGRFSDVAVSIDTSVFNASRITKLYGTRARKGPDRTERPHRVSRLISVPETLTPVSRELIQQVIDAGQPSTTSPTPINGERVPGTPIVRRNRGGIQSSDERLRVPEIIQPGNRHNALVQIAASVRSIGLTEAEIHSTLAAVVQVRMEGDLPAEEVCGIARWAAAQAPNEVLDARVRGRPEAELEAAERRQRLRLGIERIQRQLGDPNGNSNEIFASLQHLLDLQPTSGTQTLVTITSAELANAQFNLEYLILGLLVKGQPCVMAGAKKCLKTNTLIDLSVSIATGTPFLGHFNVPQSHRVALLSGESGAATIQETARRVARSKNNSQLQHAENAFWCFSLPKLGQTDTVRTLVNYVDQHDLEVICIDPAYLCMPLGDAAGNLFSVGQMLVGLSKVTDETGVTVVLAHHTTKTSSSKSNGVDQFAPPELENIAWSGFQEWARQWLLLGRRERFDPDRIGHHKLWLSAGGSAGHAGLWGVNIDEGSREDVHGRRWQVSVNSARTVCTEQQTARSTSREAEKRRKELEKLEEDQIEAVRVYRNHPDGETGTQLRNALGMSGARWGVLNNHMLAIGLVERCKVKKNSHFHDGFRLRDATGTTRTGPDSPACPGDGGGSGTSLSL